MLSLFRLIRGAHSPADRRAAEPDARYLAQGGTVRVDVPRMRRALESESHEVPSGLTREQIRERILAAAKRQK